MDYFSWYFLSALFPLLPRALVEYLDCWKNKLDLSSIVSFTVSLEPG